MISKANTDDSATSGINLCNNFKFSLKLLVIAHFSIPK